MSKLTDWQIRELARNGMITPFLDYGDLDKSKNTEAGRISYGLSTTGYDIRLSKTYKQPIDIEGIYLNPKLHRSEHWLESAGDTIVIPGKSFVLASSLEYIKMPRNVMATALTKSTYARIGVFFNVTPIEPGWEGIITVEIANLGQHPVIVFPDEGVMQLLFEEIQVPERSYADKGGKYQGQTGITHAKGEP